MRFAKFSKPILLFLFMFIFCPLSFAAQEITIPSRAMLVSPDQTFKLRDATEGLDYFLVDYRGSVPIQNANGVLIQKASEVVFVTSLSDAQKAKDLAFAEMKGDALIVHDLTSVNVKKTNYDNAHNEIIFKRTTGKPFYAESPQIT